MTIKKDGFSKAVFLSGIIKSVQFRINRYVGIQQS